MSPGPAIAINVFEPLAVEHRRLFWPISASQAARNAFQLTFTFLGLLI